MERQQGQWLEGESDLAARSVGVTRPPGPQRSRVVGQRETIIHEITSEGQNPNHDGHKVTKACGYTKVGRGLPRKFECTGASIRSRVAELCQEEGVGRRETMNQSDHALALHASLELA